VVRGCASVRAQANPNSRKITSAPTNASRGRRIASFCVRSCSVDSVSTPISCTVYPRNNSVARLRGSVKPGFFSASSNTWWLSAAGLRKRREANEAKFRFEVNLGASAEATRPGNQKHPDRGVVRHHDPGTGCRPRRGCATSNFRSTIGVYSKASKAFHLEVAE
jgi:hypothetical protein